MSAESAMETAGLRSAELAADVFSISISSNWTRTGMAPNRTKRYALLRAFSDYLDIKGGNLIFNT